MIFTVMTGYFKDFLFFMLIILVHEFGHASVATFFRWNIEKIKILPFGGLTIFHEDINRPLFEEFFILIAGPLTQTFFCAFVSPFLSNPSFWYYHKMILFFNLLPITPLDGSKLCNIICNFFFPYLKSYQLTNEISIFAIFLLFSFLFRIPFNLFSFLMVFFLSLETIRSIKREKLFFHRFLFERYQKEYYFKKRIHINSKNVKKMRRDHLHLFKVKKNWHSEREILKERFDFKGFL